MTIFNTAIYRWCETDFNFHPKLCFSHYTRRSNKLYNTKCELFTRKWANMILPFGICNVNAHAAIMPPRRTDYYENLNRDIGITEKLAHGVPYYLQLFAACCAKTKYIYRCRVNRVQVKRRNCVSLMTLCHRLFGSTKSCRWTVCPVRFTDRRIEISRRQIFNLRNSRAQLSENLRAVWERHSQVVQINV